ncbi:MAG: ABC transporter substrate-binding protein [Candidatus Binatia bacterium]|nr:ABC transporter substrate-binding protein [Candidatus Binatia bacterium]
MGTWGTRAVALALVFGAVWAGCAAKVQAPPEPPGTVRRAEEAFRLRDYERAIELYKTYAELVRRDPYVPRVLYKAALAQYQLGRYEDVLATLEDLQSRYPEKRWVQVEALRGDAQRALGKSVAAIQSWDHAFAVARPDDESKLRLRVATVARSLSDEELGEASQLVESKPVQEILAAVVAQRQHPEIPEPLPEFPEESASDLAFTKGREEPPPAEAAARGEGALPPLEGRSTEAVGELRLIGVLAPNSEAAPGLLHAVTLAVGSEHVVMADTPAAREQLQGAFRKLADDPNVLAVVTESTSRELAALARERAVPLVDVAESEPAPYVVAAGLPPSESLEVLLDYAVHRARLRRFAVVYPDTLAGRQFLTRAQAEITRRGGEVVGSDAYAPDTRGITVGLLRRWRDRENMQAVLLADQALAAAPLARLLQAEMPDIPLLGVNDWSQLTTMIPGVSGVVFTSALSPDRAQHPFVEDFRAAMGRLPTTDEVSAYEAALWLAKVASELPEKVARAEVWAALQRSSQIEGPSGVVAVAGARFVRRPFVLQFAKGELHEVASPQEPVALAGELESTAGLVAEGH